MDENKKSKLDLTQKTGEPKPFTGARIIFGMKPPKNWRLNGILQKDPEYQKLRRAWDNETDPEMKERLHLKLCEYRAKVRKEHKLLEGE